MSIINIKITILLIIIMVVWVVAYACQEWSSVHRSLRDLTTLLLLHYDTLNSSYLTILNQTYPYIYLLDTLYPFQCIQI